MIPIKKNIISKRQRISKKSQKKNFRYANTKVFKKINKKALQIHLIDSMMIV